jgi:hypothetical protein
MENWNFQRKFFKVGNNYEKNYFLKNPSLIKFFYLKKKNRDASLAEYFKYPKYFDDE